MVRAVKSKPQRPKLNANIDYLDLLDLRFAKVVHWNVIGDAERIETDVITNVSPATFWVWKERDGGALLRLKSGGLGGYM